MQTTTHVIQLGNPLLRRVSEPIAENEFETSSLNQLSEMLFQVMHEKKGLGLAAPQIGLNKRAIVFGMKSHPIKKYLSSIPYTVLFNPSFDAILDAMEEDYEGCLSVEGLRGKVLRYKHIFYKGYDVEGNLIEREVSDFHARVIQHEIDHLNGVIFVDKVIEKTLGFHNELSAIGALQ